MYALIFTRYKCLTDLLFMYVRIGSIICSLLYVSHHNVADLPQQWIMVIVINGHYVIDQSCS